MLHTDTCNNAQCTGQKHSNQKQHLKYLGLIMPKCPCPKNGFSTNMDEPLLLNLDHHQNSTGGLDFGAYQKDHGLWEDYYANNNN